MNRFIFEGKTYEVDALGYLLHFDDWDESFARGIAPSVSIHNGLTKEHWDIIYFIRDTIKLLGRCPLVYETYKMSGLPLREIRRLFPTGYLRGACKLAGVTYKEAYIGKAGSTDSKKDSSKLTSEKTYEVDKWGFLVDSSQWDELYASFKAQELGMETPLTNRHWDIIHYLRRSYANNGAIPTVYETCEAFQIELEELRRLFPTGYHRGAVKISGLRAR